MKLSYYLRRFYQVPAVEKRLLVKGFLLSLPVFMLVYLFPLKTYMHLLKTKPSFRADEEHRLQMIRLTRRTMRRISRFSPVTLSCLVRSIVFKLLLNKLGVESTIALGVNNSRLQLLKAHAFVKVGERVVFLGKRNFKTIYLFD